MIYFSSVNKVFRIHTQFSFYAILLFFIYLTYFCNSDIANLQVCCIKKNTESAFCINTEMYFTLSFFFLVPSCRNLLEF